MDQSVTSETINTIENNSQLEFRNKPKFLLEINYVLFRLKKNKVVFFMGVLLVMLFSITTFAMAVAGIVVYSDAPVPILANYKLELSAIFYKIPLLPKTKQQIIIASLTSSEHITSYKNDLTTSIEMQNTGLGNGTFELQAKGTVDLSDPNNPSTSQDMTLSVVVLGQPINLSSKLLLKDYNVYLKIEDVSENILSFLTVLLSPEPTDQSVDMKEKTKGILAHWIKVTDEKTSNIFKDTIIKNQKDSSDYTQLTKDILSDKKIFSKITKEGDEKIKNIASYHLQIKPDKEFLEAFYEHVKDFDDKQIYQSKEEFSKLADEYEYMIFDIWVDKKDGFVNKISFQSKASLADFKTPEIPSLEQTGQIQESPLSIQNTSSSSMILNVSSTFSEYNKPVRIDAPSDSITPEEFLTLFQSTFQLLPQASIDEKSSIDRDLSVFREAINSHYVTNGKYPDTLSQLFGLYIPSYNSLSNDISDYTYRRGKDHYVIFTAFQNPDPFGFGSDSPYYGFSSKDGIVRQLSIYEINPE